MSRQVFISTIKQSLERQAKAAKASKAAEQGRQQMKALA
jgi:hypothetical protein